MKTFALLSAAVPAALALAACSEQPAAPDPGETAMPVEPGGGIGDGATPLPSDAGEPTPSPTDTSDISEGSIPAALQGRWGMTPADCTSTRGDAKGLLRITPTALQFYESVGRLGTIAERGESSIRAAFDFTGEGMSWTREETLTVKGDTLTRIERGDGQPDGTYTYTRCAT